MAPEELSKCLLEDRYPFGERSLFRDKVFHCTVIWSLPLQEAKILFQIYLVYFACIEKNILFYMERVVGR